MLIELSPEDMLRCHQYGVQRAEHYIAGRRPNMKNGLTESDVIRFNVHGCMGELAVAQATGLPWTGKAGAGRYDVGDRIEVRSTTYRSGKLIVKEHETDKCPPSTPYVLAIILGGTGVKVAGWQTLDYVVEYGDCYEQKGITFYAVPQGELAPIGNLS